MKQLLVISIFIYLCHLIAAQADGSIKLIKFKDGIHHWNLDHPKRYYDRYDRSEFEAIADNFVNWQNYDGGWPKNIDWLAKLDKDSIRRKMKKRDRWSTIDNRNTYPQIEYLSEAYKRTSNQKYRTSAEKGLNYILELQNPLSGGWRGWDIDAITYNDEIMTGIMNLFLDIKIKDEKYAWISKDLYTKICASLDRAIEVTLKCQIKQNGKKTAWCQQHSHKTLRPMQARTFELRSITANESSDILIFLMRIQNPSKKIKDAINAGVNWLNKSKIKGLKIERKPLPKGEFINHEYPYDLIEVKDPKAKAIWARFYELDSNKPFLCNRDGKKVYHLKNVLPERRTGYEWYGYWPEKVLKEYSIWTKRKDVH